MSLPASLTRSHLESVGLNVVIAQVCGKWRHFLAILFVKCAVRRYTWFMLKAFGAWLSLASLMIATACPSLNAELAVEVYADFNRSAPVSEGPEIVDFDASQERIPETEVADFSAQQEKIPDMPDYGADAIMLKDFTVAVLHFQEQGTLAPIELQFQCQSTSSPPERPPKLA